MEQRRPRGPPAALSSRLSQGGDAAVTALAAALVACCAIVAGCYLVTVETVRAYLERHHEPLPAAALAEVRDELQRQREQLDTLRAQVALRHM